MSLEGWTPQTPPTNLGLVARSLIECGAFQPPFEDLLNTTLSLVSPYKALQPSIKRNKATKSRPQRKLGHNRDIEFGPDYVQRSQSGYFNPESGSLMKRSTTAAKMLLDLRNHPQILNSMHFHWSLLSPDAAAKCTRSDFVAALTRWYIAMVPGIEHGHAEKMANIECNATKRRAFTSEIFFEKLFQITHNWCHTMNPVEYCNFLALLFHRIAVGDMQTMKFNWRPIDKISSLSEDEQLDSRTPQLPFRIRFPLSDADSVEDPTPAIESDTFKQDVIENAPEDLDAASASSDPESETIASVPKSPITVSVPESAIKLSELKNPNVPNMIKLNSALCNLRPAITKQKAPTEKSKPQGSLKSSIVLLPFAKSSPKSEPALIVHQREPGDADNQQPRPMSSSNQDLAQGEDSNKMSKNLALAIPILQTGEVKLANHNERLKRRIRKATRNEHCSNEAIQTNAEKQRLLVAEAIESINWTQVLMSQHAAETSPGKSRRNKTMHVKTMKKGRRKQSAKSAATRKAKKSTKAVNPGLDLGISANN